MPLEANQIRKFSFAAIGNSCVAGKRKSARLANY